MTRKEKGEEESNERNRLWIYQTKYLQCSAKYNFFAQIFLVQTFFEEIVKLGKKYVCILWYKHQIEL